MEYSGMLVKELAAISGVKKKTIDSYLGNRGYTPSVEAAVSIARALGVSVEFLVTGKENKNDRFLSALPNDLQEMIQTFKDLHIKDRFILLNLARLLKNR
ncbi:MAG: helix-turn-helix domain-containing protein [Treponema sp.]|nr:helix-turn-helix domain-containing protein [Treponema sp.]